MSCAAKPSRVLAGLVFRSARSLETQAPARGQLPVHFPNTAATDIGFSGHPARPSVYQWQQSTAHNVRSPFLKLAVFRPMRRLGRIVAGNLALVGRRIEVPGPGLIPEQSSSHHRALRPARRRTGRPRRRPAKGPNDGHGRACPGTRIDNGKADRLISGPKNGRTTDLAWH